MIVLNQLGSALGQRIRAEAPGVDVVDLATTEAAPDGTHGDVLLTLATPDRRVPALGQLDALGVRWVHLASTGVEAAPLAALRGRLVTCSRGATATAISEFVLAAMLAFEKRLPDVWVDEPPAHWAYAELGGLAGRTLGLVGLGTIGAAVARRALAFDMRVVAVRRRPAPSPVEGVEIVDLDRMLPAADHVVVAAPATARTRHLLDGRALSLVRPGVHLVNIARGALVDQDALRVALDDGRVGRATLDVCEPEPLPAGHWLYRHPRVRLSPHISWSSPAMLGSIGDLFLANLRRFRAGEPLDGLVDLDEGY